VARETRLRRLIANNPDLARRRQECNACLSFHPHSYNIVSSLLLSFGADEHLFFIKISKSIVSYHKTCSFHLFKSTSYFSKGYDDGEWNDDKEGKEVA
jgi:hypothetical protein